MNRLVSSKTSVWQGDRRPMRYRPYIRQASWIGLALAIAVVAGACNVSTDEVADASIPVQDAALVALGGQLYAAHCASCHGTDLKGTDRGPSHLSAIYRPGHHADGAFALAAKVGVRQHHWRFGNMAPVEGLADDDLAAIVAFVREQQRLGGLEPYPP